MEANSTHPHVEDILFLWLLHRLGGLGLWGIDYAIEDVIVVHNASLFLGLFNNHLLWLLHLFLLDSSGLLASNLTMFLVRCWLTLRNVIVVVDCTLSWHLQGLHI